MAACQSVELTPPEKPAASLLSVRVYISSATDGSAHVALNRVYFARLPEGSNDPLAGREYEKTNYKRGPRGYVANIKPGRYAAVCVVALVEGKEQFIYLEDKIVRASIIDVGPGQVIDMGTVRGNRDVSWSQADATQVHFRKRILHQPKSANQLQKMFPKALAMRGSYGRFDRDGDSTALRAWVSKYGWTERAARATAPDSPSSK